VVLRPGAGMKFHALGLLIYLFGFNAAGASECAYSSEKSMLSRVVAIDSANGAIYQKKIDHSASGAPLPVLLNDKEIVLSFDQGPHATNTEYILYTLDRYCVKAVFFFTGSAALANPNAVREVAQRGHTLAAGPWSASADFANISAEEAKSEIEKGLTAVAKAADAPVAPFFRIPTASPASDVLLYLKERGVSLWSYDIASGDNEPGVTAAQLASRAVARIREKGKGVIQFHDARKVTVDALDDILSVVKHSGFKVVQIVPATSFTPKEEYLAALPKPALKAFGPSRASQSLVEVAKRRARAHNDEEPVVRRPARSRQPQG
jgi:peptidoglycan/xylan/chitin deacetylase (PgdA/CDA1 family)